VADPGRASILIGLGIEEGPPHPEGYVLRIEDQIVLTAADPRGLFYGLQTLRQVLDASAVIPRCVIRDWPALDVRGFYFDLTRQVPTTDYLRTILDRLAAAKINTLAIQYREFFPYEGLPFIVSKSSYTAPEMREFVQYAADRHIQIVPLLQSLSFQEHILRAQPYADLREQPGNISAICPSHPDSFRLYSELAEQLLAAHPDSQYFHIAGDEANTLGDCERCRQALARGSKATLMTGFTNKIIRFLLDRGVKPMMWADMLFGHFEDPASVPEYVRSMFAELSRDVIAADWDYWSTGPRTPPASRSPYPGFAGLSHIDRLLEAGFDVVGAPSCSSCCNAEWNAIDHVVAFRNITAFGKELRRRKCLGMLTTFWPTNAVADVRWYRGPWAHDTVDMCYQQVRPGLEAHWYSIWRGAECAWSAAPRPRGEYDRAFARAFLGTDDTSYLDALDLASFPMGRQTVSRRVTSKQKKTRMGKALVRIEKSLRLATRAKATVAYSAIFLRIQEHTLRWEEFLDGLPRVDAPKLRQGQVRQLQTLVKERRALERELRREYVTIYRDVHLDEEVEHRFAEERRLQEQLLWEQSRTRLRHSRRR